MTNGPKPNREQEFQDRLLAAVNELGQHTRLGLAAILEDIQRIGGLQAAKKCLRSRSHISLFLDPPSEYFLATKRYGRMDLSIEAIALDPRWQGLFTPEEIDEATATLSEHGFNPALEAPAVTGTSALVTAEHQPSLARIRVGEIGGDIDLDSFSVPTGRSSECEVSAEWALALREGQHPSAHPVVRGHIAECLECRDLYPDLAAAFERFDEEALIVWDGLLTIFQASMELRDEQLKKHMLLEPEDYEEPGEYEVDLDRQLSEFFRPICAWRAVRVGCQLGRFMSAFARTFGDPADLWLKWRQGEIQGLISSWVRGTDRPRYLLGLLARNLLLVRSWPSESGGILWVPTDGDLFPVPRFLRVEWTCDFEVWEEVLGRPPQDLNLLGILYLAHLAAVAQVEGFEFRPTEAAVPESWEQLDGIEEMLRAIQSSQAEGEGRDEAIIGHVERIVSHLKSVDPDACEESLLAELSGVYGKLTPQARSLLLASEQMYRTRDFPAPGEIVHALTTAFERQLEDSVLSGLFEYLKHRKVEKLKPLPEWEDVKQKEKPLWLPGYRAEKCELGAVRLILRHPHAEIGKFFDHLGVDRTNIQLAIESVHPHRNAAAHGDCFDIGTAKAIRADWFHWGGRPGGIFSVFFRNE